MGEKVRKIEKYEEGGGRGVRAKERVQRCGSVSTESVPRGISKKAIFQSTSDLSTTRRPAIRNGQRACYMPLGEVVSCFSQLPG